MSFSNPGFRGNEGSQGPGEGRRRILPVYLWFPFFRHKVVLQTNVQAESFHMIQISDKNLNSLLWWFNIEDLIQDWDLIQFSNKIFEMFIINFNLSIYLLTSFNANNMPWKDFVNSFKWRYKWIAESRSSVNLNCSNFSISATHL